jgi:hypothetical protein
VEEEMLNNIREEFSFMLEQLQWIDFQVRWWRSWCRSSNDGPPGKMKEMFKNIREEVSLMLDQLQWMDPQVRPKKGRRKRWWRT